MSKQEYIQELKAGLSQIDPETREEILSDISEHFTDGRQQGKTEEEIARKLGQPGDVAAQVLEEFGVSRFPERSGQMPQPPRSQVNWCDQRARDEEWFIDESFTGITDVVADLTFCSLYLEPSPNSEFRVKVRGYASGEDIQVADDGGVLTVITKQHKSWIKWISIGIGPRREKPEITIYIPRQFTGRVKADMGSGNIVANGTTGQLDFDTGAGNIEIVDHTCDKATLDSGAGQMKVSLFEGHIKDLKIESGAGNMYLEAKETERLKIETGAGRIEAEIGKIGGKTILSSGSGSIKLTARMVEGDIKTDAAVGSTKIVLPRDANICIKADKPGVGSFKNQMKSNPSAPYTLKASASVGSLHILAQE